MDILKTIERFNRRCQADERIDPAAALNLLNQVYVHLKEQEPAPRHFLHPIFAELRKLQKDAKDAGDYESEMVYENLRNVEEVILEKWPECFVPFEKQLEACKTPFGEMSDSDYEIEAVHDVDAREIVVLTWVLKVLRGVA